MQLLKTFFALLMLALAVSATSCVSTKHKVTKAKNTLNDNPIEKAKFCAESYVPKVETKTTVKYLPGKPIRTNSVEYVTVDCDSVVAAKGTAKHRTPSIVRVPVPVYLQVDTNAILQEIDRENVAALAYKDSVINGQNRQLNAVTNDCKTAKADKSYWKGKAIWTWVIDFGVIALLGYIGWQKRKINILKQAGKYV